MAEFWLNLRFLFIFPGFWFVAWIFTYWRAGIFSRLYAKLVRNGVMSPWFFPFYELLRNVVFPHWLIRWPQVAQQLPGSKHLRMFVCVGFAYFWQWCAVLAAAVVRGGKVYSWDRFDILDPTPLVAGGWWFLALALLWWAGWTLACNVLVVWLLRVNEDVSDMLKVGISKHFSIDDDFTVEKITDTIYRMTTKSFIDMTSLSKQLQRIATASSLPILHVEQAGVGQFDFIVAEPMVDKEAGVSAATWEEILATANESKTKFAVAHNGAAPVYWDLKKIPHLLPTGKTGGGKTVSVLAAVFRYVHWNPNTLLFVVDNMKNGTNYRLLQYDPAVYAGVDDPEEMANILRAAPRLRNVIGIDTDEQFIRLPRVIRQEFDKRAELFNRYGCQDIFQYREMFGEEKSPFNILVIIEELMALQLVGEKDLSRAYEQLTALLLVGRDRPMNVILVSQKGPQRIVGDARDMAMVFAFGMTEMEHNYLLGIEAPMPHYIGCAAYNLPGSRGSIALAAFPLTTIQQAAAELAMAESHLSPERLAEFDRIRAAIGSDGSPQSNVQAGFRGAMELHKALELGGVA